ncbi:MAG: hypothetical protein V7K97_17645 [Nostoc sp.]|uniref:hypothetical protein n=1 Tax=Nostoc sp. TaxID=1180 RepID=UPI002FF477DA
MEKAQFSKPVIFIQCEAFSLSNTHKLSSQGKCDRTIARRRRSHLYSKCVRNWYAKGQDSL